MRSKTRGEYQDEELKFVAGELCIGKVSAYNAASLSRHSQNKMTRDINPLVAFYDAIQNFGCSAAEAAEAFERLSEVMAELTPAFYALGRVPKIEITTPQGQKVILENVSLDVEVETESISHRQFGNPVSKEFIVGVETKAHLKLDPDKAEELYRLIRED